MKVECGLLVDMSPDGSPSYKATYTPMQIQELLFGDNEEGVKWLVCKIGDLPPLPDGLPKQYKLEQLAAKFKDDYNDLDTGITLKFQSKSGSKRKSQKTEGGMEPPTCIRWEWVNGELVARYNWAMTYTIDEKGIQERDSENGEARARNLGELDKQIKHCEADIHLSLICYREMLESQSVSVAAGQGDRSQSQSAPAGR